MENIVQFLKEQPEFPEIVFFDIFDTILLRQVHPEYVKKMWSRQMVIQITLDCTPDELYHKRNYLEAKLCQTNKENGYDLEFRYEELCQKLYEKLVEDRQINSKQLSVKDFFVVARSSEIEIEKQVQHVDPAWLKTAQTLQEMSIPMVCISDFYLSSDMMSELLKHHKIDGFFANIFISSDYLKTKRSGALYDLVVEKLGTNPEKAIMIGDNMHSDVVMAKQRGFSTYWLERKEQCAYYAQHQQDTTDKRKFCGQLQKRVEALAAEEEMCFAPLVITFYAFIEKLYRRLRAAQVKDVFFLSREGEFLKKLFDIYQQKQGNDLDTAINTHYLIVSRRSTLLPSLKPLIEENFETIFRQYRNIALADFLLSLNFPLELVQKLALELTIDMYQKFDNFPTCPIYKQLRENTTFRSYYEQQRQEQQSNFISYLQSFQADIENQGIHIVDVGWKGTIQDHIYKIMQPHQVHGYYLGLVGQGLVADGSMKEGLLFSLYPQKNKYFPVYDANRAMFEIVLGASHGSARAYDKHEGTIRVQTQQEECEITLFKNVIAPMQQKLQIEFSNICDLFVMTHYTCAELEDFIARNHAGMVFAPNAHELAFFEKLYHVENFGVFEVTKFNKKNGLSIAERWNNFQQLILSPHNFFSRGFWGPLTLNNQGLGWLRPLYKKYCYYKVFKEI